MRERTQPVGAVVLGDRYCALGVVRSLGRHGIPCILVDCERHLTWRSRFVRSRYFFDGALESPEFADFLLALGRREHLDGWVLIACADEAVEGVARNRARLETLFRVVTPAWETTQLVINKRLTYHLAQQAAVPHPRTWLVDDEAQLAELDVCYPAIVKPALSTHMQVTLGVKALPAQTPDELREQFRLAVRGIPADLLLVQEVIPGGGSQQYSIGAYCREGRIAHALTVRRFRQYPMDFGVGTCVQPVPMPELLPLAERLVEHLGISGMVEIEFKYDARDGQYKVLDINLRPWAWHALCAACGLDLPYIHYCDLLGLPAADATDATPTYGAQWLTMTDLHAGWTEIRAGRTTPGAYLRSLAGRKIVSTIDWRDPLPTSAELADRSANIMKRLSRRRRRETAAVVPGEAAHEPTPAPDAPKSALVGASSAERQTSTGARTGES